MLNSQQFNLYHTTLHSHLYIETETASDSLHDVRGWKKEDVHDKVNRFWVLKGQTEPKFWILQE